MIEFIFMLTRDDVTLSDAREVYASIARHGRPARRLQGRRAAARGAQGADGRHPLQRARDLDRGRLGDRGGHARVRPRRGRDPPRPPDRRHADRAGAGDPRRHRREVLALRRPDRRPPCLLRGSIDEIVADTKRAAELGVDGINLLAYRYDGDVEALTRAVVGASDLPVICAGSVDSVERIRALEACGAWAFTIGTAALDGVLVENTPLSGQLEAALGAAGAPA